MAYDTRKFIFFVIFSIAWILFMLMSCSGPKAVTSETVVNHDTLYISIHDRDSIYLHDSIYTEVNVKGDTCYIYKYKQQTKWRDRLMTDTIYKAVHDTVTTHVTLKEKGNHASPSWLYVLLMLATVCISFFYTFKNR